MKRTNKEFVSWDFKTDRGVVRAGVRAEGVPGNMTFTATTKSTEDMAGMIREGKDINALYEEMRTAVDSAYLTGWEKRIFVVFHGGEKIRGDIFGEHVKDRVGLDRSSGTSLEVHFSFGVVEVATTGKQAMVRELGTDRIDRIEFFTSSQSAGGQFALLPYSDERVASLSDIAERFGVLTDKLKRMFRPETLDVMLEKWEMGMVLAGVGPLTLH